MRWHGGWRPYVPVAERRSNARKKVEKLRKKGIDIQPVQIEGRKISRTFWGKAWCKQLDSFSDYENRLPRGRSYLRNGSVCHLDIAKGEVRAMVSGSQLYNVEVAIKTLPRKKWTAVKKRCAGQIGSLLELLQGRLSRNVMAVVTDRNTGLFPSPGEIRLKCDCPDWAVMCKHVAAVLYGVGARLDDKPELLFLLRGVDHEDLIGAEIGVATASEKTKDSRKRIADDALADIFGIEMSEDPPPSKAKSSRHRKQSTRQPRKTSRVAAKRAPKRGAKTGTHAAAVKKTPASRKVGAKRAARTAPSARPVTGKAVAGLRAKFAMSQSQFARLLGVSAPSIGNWEKKPGTLNLQRRTLDAWNAAKKLTKRQAWEK